MAVSKKRPKTHVPECMKRPRQSTRKTERVEATGAPRVVIDWEQVEKMCAIFCTQVEIANILGVNIDTLADAIKREHGLSFSEYWERKSAKGNLSLRRAQFKSAVEGNVPMQIWLGKQRLGQKDKQDITSNDETIGQAVSGEEVLAAIMRKHAAKEGAE